MAFLHDLPFTTPLRCMLVDFAAGRAKNVIVKHNFVDGNVEKYLIFLPETHLLNLKIKNVAFLHEFPFTTPLRSMLVEFAPDRVKNEVWGQYFVQVFPRSRSLYKEIKKCKTHKMYKKLNSKFGRRYRSSSHLLLQTNPWNPY